MNSSPKSLRIWCLLTLLAASAGAFGQSTFTWQGGTGGDANVPSNWSPTASSNFVSGDTLLFSNSGTYPVGDQINWTGSTTPNVGGANPLNFVISRTSPVIFNPAGVFRTQSLTVESGANFTFNGVGVGLGTSGSSTQNIFWTNNSSNAVSVSNSGTFGWSGTNNANGTLIVGGSGNWTFNNFLSNLWNFEKAGSGLVSLVSTASTKTGVTTVSGGVLQITNLGLGGSSSSIGQATGAAGNIVLDGGTLRLVTTTARTTNRLFTIGRTTAGGTGTIENNSVNSAHTFNFTDTGSIAYGTTNQTRTLQLGGSNTGTNTLSVTIGDNGSGLVSLVKQDAGRWVINGTNSYTGGTTIAGGTLDITSANALGGATGGLTVNAGTLNVNNSGITVGSLSGSGGTVTTSTAGSKTVTVNSSSTTSYAGSIQNGSGTIALTKEGAGQLTLSGANTYTGNTTITGGTLVIAGGGSLGNTAITAQTGSTLRVNGSTGGGDVNIQAGATLSGTGTIGGASATTTIAGTHAPGNSPGIQTFAGNLSYDGASPVVQWELVSNTTVNAPNPGALFDSIVVGGDLSFVSPTQLQLSFNSLGSNVNWTNSFWAQDYAGTNGWLVYSVAGTTSGFSNLSLQTLNWLDGSGNSFNTARPGASFSLFQSGEDIYLTYAIPEPNTIALLIGAAGVGLWLRRRIKR